MNDVEPPMRLLTPDGRWVIEVSENAEGKFYAKVTLDGAVITDSLATVDSSEIITWVVRQMHEVMRRTNVHSIGNSDVPGSGNTENV